MPVFFSIAGSTAFGKRIFSIPKNFIFLAGGAVGRASASHVRLEKISFQN
jgi:hypothetical protein